VHGHRLYGHVRLPQQYLRLRRYLLRRQYLLLLEYQYMPFLDRRERVSGLQVLLTARLLHGVDLVFCLVAAVLAVGYPTLFHGGADPDVWGVSLLAAGLSSVVFASLTWTEASVSAQERVAVYACLLLCAYGVLQIVPLPIPVLRVLDPTRAEVANALRGVVPGLRFSSLTIDQGKTCLHISWIVGQVLTFLLIREAARRTNGSWFIAGPVLLLGGIEAVIAIVQHAASVEAVIGTSDNRDHLSGFLEMTLPFAIMCGISFLHPGNAALRFRDAIGACACLALAAATLAAILFTGSKMGFASTVGSLFIMGAIAIGAKLSGIKRWAAVAGLAALVLGLAVFLPTNELVNAFGGVDSDPTAEGRLPIAKDTLHLIAAYPWFGSGLGTYFPAFIRYQTYAVNLAWLSSHSDYLDFVSELGVLGFLILATFVGAVCVCSVRAATRGATRKIRLLGLACIGALAAILIHSIADFNMHIPANAMLFACIAGIAVALPFKQWKPSPMRLRIYVLRGFLLVAGCVASLYGAGCWAYDHWFEGHLNAERSFCRFGICDSYRAPNVLRDQYGGNIAAAPPEKILEYLRRDPAGPYRWEDLGESSQKAGRTKEARYSFERAVALAPTYPTMLYRAADFYFSLGEKQEGIRLAVAALKSDSENTDSAFREYDSGQIPLRDVLDSGLPPIPKVWRDFLRREIQQQRVAAAQTVWSWMVPRASYVDQALASEYVDFLIGQKQFEAAAQAWNPGSERIYNGDFERDPLPEAAFDWHLESVSGVEASIEKDSAHSGSRSLKLQFDGTQNLTAFGVAQAVYLKPGSYRFRAWVKAKDLSTDQGISFQVMDGAGRVYFTTQPLLGSTSSKEGDWKLVEGTFQIGDGKGLQRITLTRAASLKFDNKVRGTLRVGQVSIRQVGK
jgi:O-antigen ligase